jgi:hypothetical protein
MVEGKKLSNIVNDLHKGRYVIGNLFVFMSFGFSLHEMR